MVGSSVLKLPAKKKKKMSSQRERHTHKEFYCLQCWQHLHRPKDLVHLSASLKNLLFTSLLVCERRK